MLHHAEPGLDLPKPLRPRRPGRMHFSFHRFGDVSTLCLRCGANSGREWKETILGSPPDDALKRLLIRLGRALGRLMMSMGRQHRHHTAEVGRADLGGLLSDTPFHVHGLKGRPMRLRLGTVHWNSRGRSGVVDAVTLGYVAGDVQQPERKLQLEQAAGVDSRMRTLVRELQTIASLVGGYSPRNQRDSYLRRGNVLKYWNLERVYRAPPSELGHPDRRPSGEGGAGPLAGTSGGSPGTSRAERPHGHGGVGQHYAYKSALHAKRHGHASTGPGGPSGPRAGPPVDSASSTEYNFLAQPPPYSVYAKHDERGSESPLFLRSHVLSPAILRVLVFH